MREQLEVASVNTNSYLPMYVLANLIVLLSDVSTKIETWVSTHSVTLYFADSQRSGSQTTGLMNAMWASTTGQQGRKLSWLQGMFFLRLCVSIIILKAPKVNVFLVKMGCSGGTCIAWRGTVQSLQVRQRENTEKLVVLLTCRQGRSLLITQKTEASICGAIGGCLKKWYRDTVFLYVRRNLFYPKKKQKY